MTTLTLGEFHTMVSDALGRGTSLDSIIPRRTEMAARWLERNYTLQYMRQWRVLEVDSSATYPYIISLHDLQLKGIDTIRRRRVSEDDGTYLFDRALKKVNPVDRESRPVGNPESYWLNGLSSIILNSVPDEDMTFEAHIQSFTIWPASTNTTWTHWLLDNATQLLLCRTLMTMVPRTRDPALWQTYKQEFDLELQSFKVSEETLTETDFVSVWEPPEFVQNDESLRST